MSFMDGEKKRRREISEMYVSGLRELVLLYTVEKAGLLPHAFPATSAPTGNAFNLHQPGHATSKSVAVAGRRAGTRAVVGGIMQVSSSESVPLTWNGEGTNNHGTVSTMMTPPSGDVTLTGDGTGEPGSNGKVVGDGASVASPMQTNRAFLPFRRGGNRTDRVVVSIETQKTSGCSSLSMCDIKSLLRGLASEELCGRIKITEREFNRFTSLLRYHEIVESALDRGPILLQESCQRNNITTEAKNQLHALTREHLDDDVQRQLNDAREQGRRLQLLVNSEACVRHLEVIQIEEQERHALQQLFCRGASSLLELQGYEKRHERHPFKERSRTLSLEEGIQREEVLVEERQSRGALYHACSSQYSPAEDRQRHNKLPFTKSDAGEEVVFHEVVELSGTVDSEDNCPHVLPESARYLPPSGAFAHTTSRAADGHSANASGLVHTSQCSDVMFVEWDPTSNTMTRSSNRNISSHNNTSTNTTTATVVIPRNATASRQQGHKIQRESPSPCPHGEEASQHPTRSVIAASDAAPVSPSRGAKKADKTRSKSTDVNSPVSSCACSNRHITPCSQKDCARNHTSTPLKAKRANGEGPMTARCPYSDDIVFDSVTVKSAAEQADNQMANETVTTAESVDSEVSLASLNSFVTLSGSPHDNEQSANEDVSSLPDEECALGSDFSEMIKQNCKVAMGRLKRWKQAVANAGKEEKRAAGSQHASMQSAKPCTADTSPAFLEAASTSKGATNLRCLGDKTGERQRDGVDGRVSASGICHSLLRDASCGGRRPVVQFSDGSGQEVGDDVEEVEEYFTRSLSGGSDMGGCDAKVRWASGVENGYTGGMFDGTGGGSSRPPPSKEACIPNYLSPTTSWQLQRNEQRWQQLFRESSRDQSLSGSRAPPATTTSVASTATSPVSTPWRRPSECLPSQRSRFPLEEGPGVWEDELLPRRPFSFDPLGDKAQEAAFGGAQRLPSFGSCSTTIRSDVVRREAAWRFKVGDTPTRTKSLTSPPPPHKKKDRCGGSAESVVRDRQSLEALEGVVDRRSGSKHHLNRRSAESSKGESKTTSRRPARATTPSYVDAFYKMDRDALQRFCLLTKGRNKSVLRSISATPKTPKKPASPVKKKLQRPERPCKKSLVGPLWR
ncbi:hypothetical protein TRVL_02136 [Trypanosoma vivax]|nr:hypothetical protein TRVL_02136 [Trypanosoma vivax]